MLYQCVYMLYVCMNEWMNEWMNVCMDVWMNVWMNECICVYVYKNDI